jgi:hypothetical protein
MLACLIVFVLFHVLTASINYFCVQAWQSSPHNKFFSDLYDRIKNLAKKPVGKNIDPSTVCFVNTKSTMIVTDGIMAGKANVDGDTLEIQEYSRGLNVISQNFTLCADEQFVILGDEGENDKMLVFVNATAHAPKGELIFHFWVQDNKEWMRSKLCDFERHLTPRSDARFKKCTAPAEVVRPPRELYFSYFSQSSDDLCKPSAYFCGPLSRLKKAKPDNKSSAKNPIIVVDTTLSARERRQAATSAMAKVKKEADDKAKRLANDVEKLRKKDKEDKAAAEKKAKDIEDENDDLKRKLQELQRQVSNPKKKPCSTTPVATNTSESQRREDSVHPQVQVPVQQAKLTKDGLQARIDEEVKARLTAWQETEAQAQAQAQVKADMEARIQAEVEARIQAEVEARMSKLQGQTPGLVGLKGQSPGLVGLQGQTPGLLGWQGHSPGLVGLQGQTPGLVGLQGQTPGLVGWQGHSPGLVGLQGQTPGLVGLQGQTPGLVGWQGHSHGLLGLQEQNQLLLQNQFLQRQHQMLNSGELLQNAPSDRQKDKKITSLLIQKNLLKKREFDMMQDRRNEYHDQCDSDLVRELDNIN